MGVNTVVRDANEHNEVEVMPKKKRLNGVFSLSFKFVLVLLHYIVMQVFGLK